MVLSLEIVQVLGLLFAASIVGIMAKRINLPYTIALVLIGLVFGIIGLPVSIELTPELVLFIFLPPLIFEGAVNMDLTHLKENIRMVFFLSFFGVVISTFVIGSLINEYFSIPLHIAFLLGAIVSPTDPISVLAIFRSMGVSRRLTTIVEGESLFNDGAGIVIFKILVAFTLAQSFTLIEGVTQFVVVVSGGVVVGAVIGYLASLFMKTTEDHLIEITLSIILAYGSYMLAEMFHVSGIIAIVTAGLLFGSYGRTFALSPTSRVAMQSFWEFFAFFVNSMVFILIGLEVHFLEIIGNVSFVLFAILATLIARLFMVYFITSFLNILNERVPKRWIYVVGWAGLRGSIPLALVLSLSPDFPYRNLLAAATYGVVIFSLLVKGLSIPKLIEKLKLQRKTESEYLCEILTGKMFGSRSSLDELDALYKSGHISYTVYREMKKELKQKAKKLEERVEKILKKSKGLRKERELTVKRYLIMAQKSAVQSARIRGLISTGTEKELMDDLNRKLDEIEEKLKKV
jgi:CPA1 family monovalent cation:H+ antiporter